MKTPPPQPVGTVKPRDASSLVIYEKRGSDIFILMGKRAKTHRFLPNVFVFPGGRVDKEDGSLTAHAPLPDETSCYLSAPGNQAHAIASAAVRETHEETGLTLGPLVNGELRPDLSRLQYLARAITPVHSPIRFNTRFLMVDANHLSGELGGSGELLHLQWFEIRDALAMPLVDVTEFVLHELRKRLTTPAYEDHLIPIFTYRNGKPFIRWIPH